MSLIPFHRGLISTGIVFCAGFAGWAFAAFRRDGGPATLLLATVFVLLAIGLAVYLWNLSRILKLSEPARRRHEGPARR